LKIQAVNDRNSAAQRERRDCGVILEVTGPLNREKPGLCNSKGGQP